MTLEEGKSSAVEILGLDPNQVNPETLSALGALAAVMFHRGMAALSEEMATVMERHADQFKPPKRLVVILPANGSIN
jgi:hypothetical protein